MKNLPKQLPAYQESLLHIYDAVDYAENAFNVPILAYSGEKDPQKAAADNIEKRLKELKLDRMTHLMAPGLEHQFPKEWQGKAEVEFSKFAGPGKGKTPLPEKIHFVTYTLRYPKCAWLTIQEMGRHYQKAEVEAERNDDTVKIATKMFAVSASSYPIQGKVRSNQ